MFRGIRQINSFGHVHIWNEINTVSQLPQHNCRLPNTLNIGFFVITYTALVFWWIFNLSVQFRINKLVMKSAWKAIMFVRSVKIREKINILIRARY